jgi:hypothetical protein
VNKLAVDIYRQDTAAAMATDFLLQAAGGPGALAKEGVQGFWISSAAGAEVVVRFVRSEGGSFVPAYDVKIPPGQRPTVSKVKDGRLSADGLAQLRARHLALSQIKQPCSPRYNTVALPDGNSGNFLVYALAATEDPNLVLVGGHYRFTISADGERVVRVERLSKSCLALNKNARPEGTKPAALFATHIVSERPLETHGYLSLLHKQPLYIGTKQGVWKVEGGEATLVERR